MRKTRSDPLCCLVCAKLASSCKPDCTALPGHVLKPDPRVFNRPAEKENGAGLRVFRETIIKCNSNRLQANSA